MFGDPKRTVSVEEDAATGIASLSVDGAIGPIRNLSVKVHNPGWPCFDDSCIEIRWDDSDGGHVHQVPIKPYPEPPQ